MLEGLEQIPQDVAEGIGLARFHSPPLLPGFDPGASLIIRISGLLQGSALQG